MSCNLLNEFVSEYQKQSSVSWPQAIKSKQLIHTLYQMTEFDNRANDILRVITTILQAMEETWIHWKNLTSEFTLSNKISYVKTVGDKLNSFYSQINQLDKKVDDDHFGGPHGIDYEKNVCSCLRHYLNKVNKKFGQLKEHVDDKKKNNKIQDLQRKQQRQQQFVANFQPQFRQQAEMLHAQINKDKTDHIQKQLLEVCAVMEEMRAHAFQQQDIMIQFGQNLNITNDNVEGGKKQIQSALKSEGQARELWMWMFISMTIMVVFLDWIKK